MKKTLRNIKICKLSNGYELSLTFHEFTNNKPGPSLGLSAAIHGNEDLNIEILRRFSLELENLNFKGRVVMLPVANPLALGSFTNRTAMDMNNLNRIFPGSKQGEVSYQIANAIVTEYIPQADYFIDFHSAGRVMTEEFTVISPKSEELELGKMLGQKYLSKGWIPGSLAEQLSKINKPAVLGEFGGGGQNNKYYIQQGLKGIKNVMKYLKMIDGKPDIPEKQYLIKELIPIQSKNGGIFTPCFSIDSLHSIVNKGDLLGTIYSPYTFEEIECFYGPFNQNLIILLIADIYKVEAGDTMFMLGNMDTIESC